MYTGKAEIGICFKIETLHYMRRYVERVAGYLAIRFLVLKKRLKSNFVMVKK